MYVCKYQIYNLVPRFLTQAFVTCSNNVGNLPYRVMSGGLALLIFRLSTDIRKWHSHKLLMTQVNIVQTKVYRCLKLVEMQLHLQVSVFCKLCGCEATVGYCERAAVCLSFEDWKCYTSRCLPDVTLHKRLLGLPPCWYCKC